jgi:hypothetical protein
MAIIQLPKTPRAALPAARPMTAKAPATAVPSPAPSPPPGVQPQDTQLGDNLGSTQLAQPNSTQGTQASAVGVGAGLLAALATNWEVIGPAITAAVSAAGALTWAAAEAAAPILGDAADTASLIQATNPAAALQVTPVTFQSIEQEGRWKPQGILAQNLLWDPNDPNSGFTQDGRVLVLQKQAKRMAASSTNQSPNPAQLQETYDGVSFRRQTLFQLNCRNGESIVTVDATWWSDGLEIWGGFAGTYSHIGFSSIFSDTASIVLNAIPFGNYYPARVLLTWSGWVNPVGPDYREFRGGITLSADSRAPGPNKNLTDTASQTPCYMQCWKLGDPQPTEVSTWNQQGGFVLSSGSSGGSSGA